MGRRRDRKPDTRLDWRDPEMPVIRDYEVQDEGLGIVVERGTEVVTDLKLVQRLSRNNMADSQEPNWREDPSYRWARPGSRKRVR